VNARTRRFIPVLTILLAVPVPTSAEDRPGDPAPTGEARSVEVTPEEGAAPTRPAGPDPLLPPSTLADTPLAGAELQAAADQELEGSPIVLREAIATALSRNPELAEQVLGPVVSEAELRRTEADNFRTSGTIGGATSLLTGAGSTLMRAF